MAYVEATMWEILEVLRRRWRGENLGAIRRATGKDRKTIRRYVRIADELGWKADEEPDDELAGRVWQHVRPGARAPGPGDAQAVLLPHLEQIKAWVDGTDGKRGLKITKAHKLAARQGIKVSYISFYRFVRKQGLQGKDACTYRMPDTAPGEVAEVDFGRLGLVTDEATGRRRLAHALIVTLVYSRHQFVYVTHSQKAADLIHGLEDAWEFFGGVPEKVVIDNLKAAVKKADRYDPLFQRAFDEYARYRDFVIDACVSEHPKGKPHVERNVPYVRENFFRGETWLNKEHVQREARRWCLETAGKRTHGTTRRIPLDVFKAEEQAQLKPLKRPRFDPPHWAVCKAHPDHCIRVSYASYTVPHKYLGQEVDVREDRAMVRVYCQGQLIKTHPRKGKGQKSLDTNDYPKEVNAYTMKDPNRMIREAREVGEFAGGFMERLLSGAHPWAKLRQAQMVLGLAKKFGRSRVDAACRRALEYDTISAYTVKEIIAKNLDNQTKGEQGRLFPPLPSRYLRPAGSFSKQRPGKEEAGDGDQAVPQGGSEANETVGRAPDAP